MLKDLQKQLSTVQCYLDNLDENYYAKQVMDAETYQKLRQKYFEQKGEILKIMQANDKNSSNLQKYPDSALQLSANLVSTWASSTVRRKESFQKIVFPEGVYYNLKNQSFRTEKVNSVFACIAAVTQVSAENKKWTR